MTLQKVPKLSCLISTRRVTVVPTSQGNCEGKVKYCLSSAQSSVLHRRNCRNINTINIKINGAGCGEELVKVQRPRTHVCMIMVPVKDFPLR